MNCNFGLIAVLTFWFNQLTQRGLLKVKAEDDVLIGIVDH